MNGGSAVGLDISGGMITRAHDRCPKSDFTVGTAERIPFSDNSFDAVSSMLAFSYLKNPGKVLRGIPRGQAWRVHCNLHVGKELFYCRAACSLPDR